MKLSKSISNKTKAEFNKQNAIDAITKLTYTDIKASEKVRMLNEIAEHITKTKSSLGELGRWL